MLAHDNRSELVLSALHCYLGLYMTILPAWDMYVYHFKLHFSRNGAQVSSHFWLKIDLSMRVFGNLIQIKVLSWSKLAKLSVVETACSVYSFKIKYNFVWLRYVVPGLYSLRRRRLTGIGIPMINLRRSDDRLRFIIGIPILIRRCLLSE